jgi:hypothetical protein
VIARIFQRVMGGVSIGHSAPVIWAGKSRIRML